MSGMSNCDWNQVHSRLSIRRHSMWERHRLIGQCHQLPFPLDYNDYRDVDVGPNVNDNPTDPPSTFASGLLTFDPPYVYPTEFELNPHQQEQWSGSFTSFSSSSHGQPYLATSLSSMEDSMRSNQVQSNSPLHPNLFPMQSDGAGSSGSFSDVRIYPPAVTEQFEDVAPLLEMQPSGASNIVESAHTTMQDWYSVRASGSTATVPVPVMIDSRISVATNSATPNRLMIPQHQLKPKGKRRGPVAGAKHIMFLLEQQVEPGVLAYDAYKKKHERLLDRDSLPTLGDCGTSIYVHIKWRGYPDFVRQVKTHDWCKPRKPLTTSKLLDAVGRLLNTFFKQMQDKEVKPGCEDWKVGSDDLNLNNVYICGLIPVTKASWQLALSYDHADSSLRASAV